MRINVARKRSAFCHNPSIEHKPDYSEKYPEAGDGRLPITLNVMRRLKKAVGEKTALYGLICGPLTRTLTFAARKFSWTRIIINKEYVIKIAQILH